MKELAESYDTKAELTRLYGNHTLAFSGLSPENSHFLAPGEEGLVNYRLVHKVAVVPGDPVCAPASVERVTRSFLDFCALRGWRAAFYQTSRDYLPAYRALKLHPFKIGEEAIIDPQTFTLTGPAIANVRVSVRRAERDNVLIDWYEGEPPEEVMRQLDQISDTWLKFKAGRHSSEMGFSMGRLEELPTAAQQADMLASIPSLSSLTHRLAPRVVTEVAMTSSGKPCAFVTFIPVYGSLSANATGPGSLPEVQNWGWALDLMRRTPDAPPGVIELLLVRAIERFRTCGAQTVSLGMAAMADTHREMNPRQRHLANFVIDSLHLLENRRTLFSFKQKFQPRWESRYVVTNTILGLPKIALAILRLRNYQMLVTAPHTEH
jgi:lysylphosphatidylglycerol synthetase-like protein (DUF2156 family)